MHADRLTHIDAFYAWDIGRAIAFADVKAFFDLLKLCRAIKPDILHLHCSKAGALGRLVGSLLRIPVIFSPRGASFLRSDHATVRRLHFLLEFVLAPFGGPVVACSGSELAALRALPCRTLLIPNGVDVAEFKSVIATEPADSSAQPFTVGILGLVKHQRMPDIVAKIVVASPPHWQWLWVGDGPDRRFLEELPNVTVTGWLDRSAAFARLALSDVVLHAARWEGMPNALLEAMALSKAVVASSVVGTRDLVTDGYTGFLVEEIENPSAYAGALQQLADSRILRARLGTSARIVVEDEYDIRRLAERWEQLYDEVLAPAGQPGDKEDPAAFSDSQRASKLT